MHNEKVEIHNIGITVGYQSTNLLTLQYFDVVAAFNGEEGGIRPVVANFRRVQLSTADD